MIQIQVFYIFKKTFIHEDQIKPLRGQNQDDLLPLQ
jgi:hypothetical protein